MVLAESRTGPAVSVSDLQFRHLVASVRDYAIFMIDPEGRVLTWNEGAKAIKGYTEAEIIGSHISRFYLPEDREAGRPAHLLQVAETEGRVEDENWRVRKDGTRFWADVVITALRDAQGELLGFVKVTRDLSERRRMAEQARLADAEAARERVLAEEARRATALREQFMSVAAHELRTPLTALQLKVQGAARTLRAMQAKAPSDQMRLLVERLEGAKRQTDRLTSLVERLLDVSRMSQGRITLELEEVDLGAVATRVVDDLSEPALSAGSEVRLRIAPDVKGRWDRSRVEQVLINLLSNAIKYGGGKPIDVVVEGTPERARFVITDRGIGIEPAEVERIFGPFERAVPLRHFGGLGLGLYIARSIVDAHHGTITVETRPGEGSTFTVELPRFP